MYGKTLKKVIRNEKVVPRTKAEPKSVSRAFGIIFRKIQSINGLHQCPEDAQRLSDKRAFQ